MTNPLCLPLDDLTGASIDFDRAADFLELAAFCANGGTALTSDLANQAAIGAAEDYDDLDEEMRDGEEELISGTIVRIEARQRALRSAYPFELDSGGDVLECVLRQDSIGQAGYVLSLVLSNLRSMTPVLAGSGLHPDEEEERRLRGYFQYFATAALAAEIQGRAWSFGFPRPDGSPFLVKLKQIWRELGDGHVEPQTGAPRQPKDDQIDVIAARRHRDRLPGFLIAVAQVATGRNVGGKSLTGHMDAFKSRWFATQPVTKFVPYMIVPFARTKEQFVDDVRVLGNVLHRLRVPRRVEEAKRLMETGVEIEGYNRLAEALQWVVDYRERARMAA